MPAMRQVKFFHSHVSLPSQKNKKAKKQNYRITDSPALGL
jgi:hypothetical protein